MRSLRGKILTLAMTSVLLVTTVVVGIVLVLKQDIAKGLDQRLDGLTSAYLSTIAGDIRTMLTVQHDNTMQALSYGLNVARSTLQRQGKVALSDQQVSWKAVNQFDKTEKQVNLPVLLLGDTPVRLNKDFSVKAPVVDEVKELVGATSTLFQRMNEQGDMLRVVTSVRQSDGARAVGTYIPAVNPDGKPNPVISTVLKGETYQGRAFVVDAWYLAMYEPMFDDQKRVIGMLYVGVKQEGLTTSLRDNILRMRVGDTGYAYVLAGKGEQKGRYVISKDGKRDGESIWEARDADGRLFIQSILQKALALKSGETAFERYPWQNPGDAAPRVKIAAIQYFEPWD